MKTTIIICFIQILALRAENLNFLDINNNFVVFHQSINMSEISTKNFDLSEDDFRHLLISLKNGDNTLFKSIFLSHSADCIKFLQIKYNATHDDAYDAMVDTLLNYRQRLVEDKITYGNIRFLFLQMASQHYLRMMKEQGRIISEELDPSFFDIEDDSYSEEQINILNKAWTKLNDLCRDLLKMNYYDGLKLNEIAERTNRKHDVVRKQKERCKESLIKLYNEISK